MQKFVKLVALSAALSLSAGSALAADTITYNSAPNDGWVFGSGNNYTPANTAVLTTDSNQQVYLRFHQNSVVAPASSSNGVYSFALGTTPLNFDWGVEANKSLSLFNYQGLSALITITNIGTGDVVTYNPFAFLPLGYDNKFQSGSVQNSFQLNWPSALDFDPGIDNTYKVTFDVNGLTGGAKSLSIFAQLGAGAGAVPEPATWAMMIMGLGIVGASMRRRRTTVSFA